MDYKQETGTINRCKPIGYLVIFTTLFKFMIVKVCHFSCQLTEPNQFQIFYASDGTSGGIVKSHRPTVCPSVRPSVTNSVSAITQ